MGIVFSTVAPLSAILTWLQVITPLLGFAGALFGVVAGFYALRIKLAQWAEWKKEHPAEDKYDKYDGGD